MCFTHLTKFVYIVVLALVFTGCNSDLFASQEIKSRKEQLSSLEEVARERINQKRNGEVSERETEAEYFPADNPETKNIGNTKFNFWITIPSDWKAFGRSENGDGYFIECENKNIDIRVYGQNDVLPSDHSYKNVDGSVASEFVFDNGLSGWQTMKEKSYIKFFYSIDEKRVEFYISYENDLEWYDANKEKILMTAKTLRNGELTQ